MSNMVNLGNAGDSSTMIKVFCDLQTYGYCIVRQGHREGLPVDKPSIWIFCPLLRKNFPRDRILVEDCKKCKEHFKGLSQPIENLNKHTDGKDTSFKINMIPGKKREHKEPQEVFNNKELEEAIKKTEEQDRIWKEEEEKTFPKKRKKGSP